MPKLSQIRLRVSQLEPGIRDYRLPWAFSKHKPGLMLETVWRTPPLTILPISNHQSPGYVIITPSFSSFGVVFSNQRFSNCIRTADVWIVMLSSHCFYGNKVFKMNTEFYCHFCSSSTTIFRQSSWMYGDPFHGFRPLLVLADDVLPNCICRHNLVNCCSVYIQWSGHSGYRCSN